MVTSWSRISCAVMKPLLHGQCSRSAILYVLCRGALSSPGHSTPPSLQTGGVSYRCLTRTTLDGEWNRQEMGRHATSMELHLLRQDENRPHGSQDSPHGAANEPSQEPREDGRGDARRIRVWWCLCGDPGGAGTVCPGYVIGDQSVSSGPILMSCYRSEQRCGCGFR